jgi:O-antigen biosynthesis protein
MIATPQILFIGSVWPEPNSSAAGSRTMQLIELFQSLNYNINFACAAADSEFSIDFEKHRIHKINIQLNNSSFDDFVKKLSPAIVIFDRFMTEEQFGWRVAENCPEAIRVLDTIDLHCLRLARQQAFKEKRAFRINDLLLTDVAKREIASIYRCDLTLMISEYEMKLLQSVFKIEASLIHYTPFLLDNLSEEKTKHWLSFEQREHFVTIGNFLHEPNWNGVLFLKESIWPIIRKHLPDAELHVYGAYPSPKVNQLHQPKDGFLIKGRAENAHEVMSKARVCLAPLRFGAGLKGKLIDAMECGTPNITTPVGAEAMHGKLDWAGIIANDADHFAKASIDLYTNQTLWLKAQKQGIQIINQIFDKTSHSNLFIEKLKSLKENLHQHREQNFMGAMLMHHTISGTKYMAKWIEEKNKIH